MNVFETKSKGNSKKFSPKKQKIKNQYHFLNVINNWILTLCQKPIFHKLELKRNAHNTRQQCPYTWPMIGNNVKWNDHDPPIQNQHFLPEKKKVEWTTKNARIRVVFLYLLFYHITMKSVYIFLFSFFFLDFCFVFCVLLCFVFVFCYFCCCFCFLLALHLMAIKMAATYNSPWHSLLLFRVHLF